MIRRPDFEALFRVSPYPYLLMDTELNIIGANNAYLQSTGRTEQEIVGRYVFDAFPANPDDPDSTNITEVRTSLERAIATGKPDTTPFLRYSIPRSTPEGTVFEERYWSTVHTPVADANGDVIFVAQNAIDVTDLYSFNRKSQVASVDQSIRAVEGAENFNRAQMHEAMLRILNDERGHLRNLFNQAPGFIAVLTGRNHVFEMVNEAYYQLVGHRELIGRPVWEALPEVAGQGFEELLDNVFATGKPFVGRGLKVSVQRKAGGPLSEIYIDLLYQPLFDADGAVSGIFTQGHEVTETVLAQAAQRESEERLNEGMLAARMVVWDWDIATHEMVFSENAAVVLGFSPGSIDTVSTAIHPDDLQRITRARERAIAERSDYREIVRFFRADDGRMIWLDVRGKVRCDAAGIPFAVRGVTLDITDRMRAEQELRDADRRKDEFLAMLAHELRNPLAPISSAAELMKFARLDEARLQQASDIIIRQVGHLTGLVDDLIDVSRVTRGLVTADLRPQDARRIVSDAIEQVRPLIEARRHRLEVLLPGESAMVSGDQKRLVQVLTNLLNNAAKYTPEGGSIRLRMEVQADVVMIDIADDGIGMDRELLPRVFDLFTQGERAIDRSQGGLGVGLALVKSLVELHGGSVTADSAGAGKGSTFRLRLPMLPVVRKAGGAHGPGALSGSAAPRPQPDKALRIMVVDDNPDAALMLAMFLEASGHRTVVEHDSAAALERARADVPDVCLLDIGLPDMDGNELARRLRAHPETAGIALIAVTGYGQEHDRNNAHSAGFDHHLVKPVDTVKLTELLARIGAG